MKKTKQSISLSTLLFTVFIGGVFHHSANGQNQPRGERQGPPNFKNLLKEMDADNDGLISALEAKGPLKEKFGTIDTNKDGFINAVEFQNAPKPQREGKGQRPPRN